MTTESTIRIVPHTDTSADLRADFEQALDVLLGSFRRLQQEASRLHAAAAQSDVRIAAQNLLNAWDAKSPHAWQPNGHLALLGSLRDALRGNAEGMEVRNAPE